MWESGKMKEQILLFMLTMFLIAIVAIPIILKWTNFAECRAFGHSFFYCVTR